MVGSMSGGAGKTGGEEVGGGEGSTMVRELMMSKPSQNSGLRYWCSCIKQMFNGILDSGPFVWIQVEI